MPHPVPLAGEKDTRSNRAVLQRDGLRAIFRSGYCQTVLLYLEITHAQKSYGGGIKNK